MYCITPRIPGALRVNDRCPAGTGTVSARPRDPGIGVGGGILLLFLLLNGGGFVVVVADRCFIREGGTGGGPVRPLLLLALEALLLGLLFETGGGPARPIIPGTGGALPLLPILSVVLIGAGEEVGDTDTLSTILGSMAIRRAVIQSSLSAAFEASHT